jgi:hypothetical protein
MDTKPRVVKLVNTADLKSAGASPAGSSPAAGTTNPNNCSTCLHKKDPDGGWCYMFRNEPTEVCGLHTTTYHIGEIVKIDFETAEKVLVAFRLKHLELAEFHKVFLARIDKDPNIVFKPYPYRRSNETLVSLMQNLGAASKLAERPKRDKVRKSSKTGATWPKPKGGY